MKFEVLQRLVKEAKELKQKEAALAEFVTSEAFNELDNKNQKLLTEQMMLMSKYLNVLRERLKINLPNCVDDIIDI